MSVLPIRIVPDEMLRQKAKRISQLNSKGLAKLIDDMIDTMQGAQGVGLAANQVGILHRVIVIQLPDDEKPRVFINPELVKQEGARVVEEGCLSIPGYRGNVWRSEKVQMKALDKKGKAVKLKAEDLLAQALEHEIDHLNGILYIDRLADKDQLFKIDVETESGQYLGEPTYTG